MVPRRHGRLIARGAFRAACHNRSRAMNAGAALLAQRFRHAYTPRTTVKELLLYALECSPHLHFRPFVSATPLRRSMEHSEDLLQVWQREWASACSGARAYAGAWL